LSISQSVDAENIAQESKYKNLKLSYYYISEYNENIIIMYTSKVALARSCNVGHFWKEIEAFV